jgi:hypothetical protein
VRIALQNPLPAAFVQSTQHLPKMEELVGDNEMRKKVRCII